MEGALWKWTNYIHGWQARWFVLDEGILAYYKSQDEVNQGCKGSIMMAACEIIVHPTDRKRLDLHVPHEQHFYLRAATAQERQQWLIGLGSAKACLTATVQKPELGEGQSDTVKSKKSELRLYCDLLSQQVHSIKVACTECNPPDIEKLDDASSLLKATCDTFIRTLEECMKIANASYSYETPHTHITDVARAESPVKSSHIHLYKNNNMLPYTRKNSLDKSRHSPSAGTPSGSESSYNVFISEMVPRCRGRSQSGSLDHIVTVASSEVTRQNKDEKSSGLQEYNPQKESTESQEKILNFFSTQPVSFVHIELEAGGIPTQKFLDACQSIIAILDLLGSTAFAPVKMDVNWNIMKVHQKFLMSPQKYSSLQKIVLDETEQNVHNVANSATEALRWLNRGTEFIVRILQEFLQADTELYECVQQAYNDTLKQYHSWVVRGVFALALKAVPYRRDFIIKCERQPGDHLRPNYNSQLEKDIKSYVTALSAIVHLLSSFYTKHGLDKSEAVS
ncbi:PREDICTED: pleckstrin homology domain-containing family A member 8-like isoform X2 [Priapulus caudatus]|uniref:Pleckstrin homology domain-containing family A member 8 n=1 Tax=Priapulus caudatus TaxID=37621 RepID=A0ABM1EAQ2_PRICU|nr:PREDICTED: pleckstrin homology domain-containing family A member 8-like isoform X2 [Priapulus caudatus]